MPTTLVRGRYVVVRADPGGQSKVLTDGAVVQLDGVILDVGGYQEMRGRYPEAQVFGNGRQFLFPGLVNAHHHGRGVSTAQTGQWDGFLETWIHRGLGRRSLDPYLMGLYTLMQQVRSGTTSVMFNQSAMPAQRVVAEANATLRAFETMGVRVAFSIAYRNQCRFVYGDDDEFLSSLPVDLAQRLRAIVAETDMPLEDYLGLADDLARHHAGSADVRVLVSPQNYHWCDEDTQTRIAAFARGHGLGIHTHLVETAYQRLYAERRHGQTPARRLHQIGFLGPDVSLAHGVWLTEDDLALLAETGTAVCHNPGSNLRLRSGVAPVLGMFRAGVPVALGTDSAGLNDDDDMLQEMRLALRLHRPPGMDVEALSAHQVLHMATVGGARVTGFGDAIGTLERGRRADMVLADSERPLTPYLDDDLDPVEALVTRVQARDIQTVFINGRVTYQGGVFPGLDERAIVGEIAALLGGPLPEETRERRRMIQQLEPYLRGFYAGWELPGTPLYRYQSIH